MGFRGGDFIPCRPSRMQTPALRATFHQVLLPICAMVPVRMSKPRILTPWGNLTNTALIVNLQRAVLPCLCETVQCYLDVVHSGTIQFFNTVSWVVVRTVYAFMLATWLVCLLRHFSCCVKTRNLFLVPYHSSCVAKGSKMTLNWKMCSIGKVANISSYLNFALVAWETTEENCVLYSVFLFFRGLSLL